MSNDELVEKIMSHVTPAAEDHPMIFIRLMVERAVHEQGAEAVPLFTEAIRDMGHWYKAQAAGLDAVLQLRKMAGEK